MATTLGTRFALDNITTVGGAFLVVSTLAFSAPAAGWLGFGVSAAVFVAALASAVAGRRTSVRIGHGALSVVALWSLIAALVFSGTALTWLVFADAIALAVVALVDLTVHEVSTERVVHTLDVRSATSTVTATNGTTVAAR